MQCIPRLTRADLLGRTAISYLRFSSLPQEKGSTIDRQQETLNAVIQHFGLVLDQSLTDRGLSASKGQHRTRGRLRDLLDMVARGEIRRGTVLVIEAIDRLFREGVFDVFEVLKQLVVDGGMILVTGDMTIWCPAAIDSPLNHKLIAEINAARDYSMRLSEMAAGAHAKKRKMLGRLAEEPEAEKPIINSRPPGWISRVGNEYLLHPVHSVTVRRLFDRYSEGYSCIQIAAALNREGVPVLGDRPRGSRPEWRAPRIGAILRDRKVLGFFQPCKRNGVKHVPVGGEVRLYPAAIDAGLWLRVQELMNHRQTKLRGRKGLVPNLFTGRIVCGTCGAAMRVDTGGRRVGERPRHFQCSRWVEGRSCSDATRYDVAHFEREILFVLVRWTGLAPRNLPDVAALDAEIAELQVQEEALDKAIDSLLPSLAASPSLAARVERMSVELDGIRARCAALSMKRQAATSSDRRDKEVAAFMRQLVAPAVQGDVGARERLRSLIAKLDFLIQGSAIPHALDVVVGEWRETVEPRPV